VSDPAAAAAAATSGGRHGGFPSLRHPLRPHPPTPRPRPSRRRRRRREGAGVLPDGGAGPLRRPHAPLHRRRRRRRRRVRGGCRRAAGAGGGVLPGEAWRGAGAGGGVRSAAGAAAGAAGAGVAAPYAAAAAAVAVRRRAVGGGVIEGRLVGRGRFQVFYRSTLVVVWIKQILVGFVTVEENSPRSHGRREKRQLGNKFD
jgi:hypothetical protein